jgi:hypothetical protein
MRKKTPQNQSFFQNCRNFFYACLQIAKNIVFFIRKTSRKNRLIFEKIQLTFIYFFAFVVMMYSIRTLLGYFPEILFTIFPFLVPIFEMPAFSFLVSPDKMLFMYMIIDEICINRPFLGFSLLVKFNILLILSLEQTMNLPTMYWDLLFNRELSSLYGGGGVATEKTAAMLFGSVLFFVYSTLYLYSYIQAINGRFPTFPGVLKNFTDSVAFWLQIKIIKKKK